MSKFCKICKEFEAIKIYMMNSRLVDYISTNLD